MYLNEHDRLEWNHFLRWMGFTSVSCLMDACILVSVRMQHLIIEWTSVGSRWCKESYTRLCHNVTQIVTWPITSYGGAGGKSSASQTLINRFGKKNSFHFNIEIEKPTHSVNFPTIIILSVRPQGDNHCAFSMFYPCTFPQKIQGVADAAEEVDIKLKFQLLATKREIVLSASARDLIWSFFGRFLGPIFWFSSFYSWVDHWVFCEKRTADN